MKRISRQLKVVIAIVLVASYVMSCRMVMKQGLIHMARKGELITARVYYYSSNNHINFFLYYFYYPFFLISQKTVSYTDSLSGEEMWTQAASGYRFYCRDYPFPTAQERYEK